MMQSGDDKRQLLSPSVVCLRGDVKSPDNCRHNVAEACRTSLCQKMSVLCVLCGVSLVALIALLTLQAVELNQLKHQLAGVKTDLKRLQHQPNGERGQEVRWNMKTTDVKSRRIKRNSQTSPRGRPAIARARQDQVYTNQQQVQLMIDQAIRTLYHPSAHMTLLIQNGTSSMFTEEKMFRWTAHMDNRTHNNLFEYDGDFSKLLVRSSGTYFIYTQIMYNGRTSVPTQTTCSHAVKMIPYDSDGQGLKAARDLLYSSTTQYKLGRPIYVSPSGREMAAFDSNFVSGVFELVQGDILVVQLDMFSQNCHVIPHNDRTFFGAFRLQMPHVDVI